MKASAKVARKGNSGSAPRDKAGMYAYADNVYQVALDKVGKKLNMRARLDAGMKAAEKFLRKQKINLTRDQIRAYYKRNPPKPAEPTAEERVKKADRIKRDFEEVLERLGDVRDAGTVLFGKQDAGAFDHAAIGMFIESAIDRVGRDLEGLLPQIGVKFTKDELRFRSE